MKRSTAASVLVMLIAAVSLVPATASKAAFPGLNGTIYYTQYTGTAMDLYSTEDPSSPTMRAHDFWEAAVSPDGSRIAAVGYGTHGGLYLMGPDGSNPTLATSWLDGIDARQPSWSPDGTRLAITYTYGILIVNLGDGRITQFHSKGLDKVSDPAWSPDGKRLAFTGAVYDGVDWLTPRLYQSQLSGRGRVELTDGSFQPYAPAWSPDGTAIAFQTINTAEIHVFTVPSAGGSVKDLTAAGFWASPAWSPDGSRIAYESGCEVWTIATDGSDPQLYAQGICGGYYIRDIEWSAGCTIVGSPDADVLTGTAGDDRICGLGGNDSITGGDGNDAIFGGDGVDTVTGDLGDDIVSGGRGNDRLDGGIGADILVGGPGKGTDTLRGRDGNDILLTLDRAGGDVANAGAGTDSCSTDKLDTTKSCERAA